MIESTMVKEKDQVRVAGFQQRIISVVAILLGFGFIMTLNLGYNSSTEALGEEYYFTILKFVCSALAGMFLGWFVSRMNSRSLFIFTHALALVSLLLLIYTWQWGAVVNNARRWIDVFGFRFQPVEIFRFALALGLASVFSNAQLRYVKGMWGMALNLLIWVEIALSLLLIYMQPNHSAILMIFAVVFVIALMSKFKWQYVIGVALIAAIVVGSLIWLSPEKRNRILALISKNSARDSITLMEERYQVERALEAEAVGGLFGHGIGHSIVRYSLPAASTDFIYAIIVEETGFMGGFLLLAAYLYLIHLALSVTAKEKDPFLRLSGVGVILFFTLNIVVHVMVNLDLAPTTGVPLPLVSQGGTALLFHLVSIGLILNLARRRDCGINDIK